MNDLALLPENPVAVLTDAKTYSEFYAKMKAETDAFVPDISTVKGRGEIAALAYKVTRTKTAIDAAGKKLNEEAREKINAVDASRRKIREELDALADAVRKPLTEWDDAEKARKDRIEQDRAVIADLYVSIHPADTSDELRRRWNELDQFHPNIETHRDEMAEIVELRQKGLDVLAIALDRAVMHEAAQAELTKLRAEAEAREIAEREREAVETAKRIEQERVEREKAEAAKREQERHDREARAVETARAEALAKAHREHAEQMANIEAENRRLAQAEADRLAAVEKTKREEAARQADRKHRGEIMKAAKETMMTFGADEETARKIVLAIVAGEIPNTRISF